MGGNLSSHNFFFSMSFLVLGLNSSLGSSTLSSGLKRIQHRNQVLNFSGQVCFHSSLGVCYEQYLVHLDFLSLWYDLSFFLHIEDNV
jgi:hypothetical protein